jgi:hypothetical protein
MKNSMLLTSYLILINVVMMSCSLNNDVECPTAFTGTLSATEIEFVGTWAITNIVSEDAVDLTDDAVNNPSTNIYQQYSECKRDVVYEFKNDRTYTLKQGYVATNCQNKLSTEGTWKLDSSRLTLVTGCSSQFNNLEFDNENTIFTQEATIQFNDTNGFIVSTKVTTTYTKS